MIPGIVAQQARMNEQGAAYSTFASGYKHDNMSLSNGNRTVTSDVAGSKVAGVLDAKVTGKWYYEATLVEFGSANDEIGIGIGSYRTALNNYPGGATNALIYYWNDRVLYGNGNQIGAPGTFTEGDVIGVELDADTRTVKFRKNGGAWSSYTNLSAGIDPLMPLIYINRLGGQVTINTGQDPWHTAPESDYLPWTVNDVSPARYWRYFTNAASITPGLAHMAEFELRETIGGPSVAAGGTATADQNHDGSTVPANAFDGNSTTYWGTTFNSALPHWLQYDFGEGNEKLIAEVMLQPRTDTTEGRSPDHRILYSYDGTVFFPAHGRAGSALAQGSVNVFALFDI